MIKFEDIKVPAGLKEGILYKIEMALERQNRNRKIWGFSLMSLSVVSFIPLIIYTISEFQKTGFYSYLSLLFTDSRIVFSNFNEFLLSLVDSFPFFAITMILISIFVILISVKYATNVKKNLIYKIN